jgi:hypothetical protein
MLIIRHILALAVSSLFAAHLAACHGTMILVKKSGSQAQSTSQPVVPACRQCLQNCPTSSPGIQLAPHLVSPDGTLRPGGAIETQFTESDPAVRKYQFRVVPHQVKSSTLTYDIEAISGDEDRNVEAARINSKTRFYFKVIIFNQRGQETEYVHYLDGLGRCSVSITGPPNIYGRIAMIPSLYKRAI